MIRIKDIADELGVSTATVSNVIHGKTKKISAETVRRVQELLEERQYIPNMAAIWLSQNNSKIICIVILDYEKYEKRVLQDPFVVSMIDNLSTEIENKGYYMMIKKTQNINEIIKYATMWNMAGLILIGFSESDYCNLREKMNIPFVSIDGYFQKNDRFANVGIDNFDGGYQMGSYLIQKGHRHIMYIADNDYCMDHDRYMGLKKALQDNNLDENHAILKQIPFLKKERYLYYEQLKKDIRDFTAIFCASDAYAIEVMNFLIDNGFKVPENISVAGFDDIPEANVVRPTLTTIKQDITKKAIILIDILDKQINNLEYENNIIMPVELIERNSVRKV